MQHTGGSLVNLVESIEIRTNNNNISPYNNKKEVFLKQLHFFCFVILAFGVLHMFVIIVVLSSISKCPSCYNKKIKWMPIPLCYKHLQIILK